MRAIRAGAAYANHSAVILDEQDERKMADWVAARLAADPGARIGIVVPQLAARRRSLAATLDATLVPDRLLSPASARPYTVSLGGALSEVALIAFFLRSLRLLIGSVPFEEASAMLRSPYFAGAVNERDARHTNGRAVARTCQRRSTSIGYSTLRSPWRATVSDVAQLLAGLRELSQWRDNTRSDHGAV